MKNILLGMLLGIGVVAVMGAGYESARYEGHGRFQIGDLRNGPVRASYLLDTDTGESWQLVSDTNNVQSWEETQIILGGYQSALENEKQNEKVEKYEKNQP